MSLALRAYLAELDADLARTDDCGLKATWINCEKVQFEAAMEHRLERLREDARNSIDAANEALAKSGVCA